MADESYVQVSPNNTGAKIRNLAVTVMQPDGTVSTVDMQVVSIANPDGSIVDLSPPFDELILLARKQLMVSCMIASCLTNSAVSEDDLV